MKEILSMVQGVGKENGFLPWKSLNLMNTRASMKGIKKMVLVYTDGQMVQNMKDFSRMI